MYTSNESLDMDAQDTKFNYRIILAALAAVIVALGIAFYYSYAHSRDQISYLEDEKKTLVKEMTLLKAKVDHLAGVNEVADIELQDSKYEVQQLLDSVGKLNFSITKLKQDQKALAVLKSKFDSIKSQNNLLTYDNRILAEKYRKSVNEIKQLKRQSTRLAENVPEPKKLEITKEVKAKTFLALNNVEGSGFRYAGARLTKTNKASTIEKLRGCATIMANPEENDQSKVLYFQFLNPELQVIEDNNRTVTVGGNTFSKRVEVVYLGTEIGVCDAISVPEGSLTEGIYTLNVFEGERLLSSTEFQLK
ncbi:hypothetical protein [Croceivirga lutea]|uniref:hypothetical protein n=1 Tax=Croceivirga lutea TaxID=1775167 RepID=UPI001E3F7A3C|nr:hypothetical protein [Croceivirga lutea]